MKKISSEFLIRNAYYDCDDTHRFTRGDLLIRDGKIAAVGEGLAEQIGIGVSVWNADGAPVVPGLADVHTHGRVGSDFITASESALHDMAASYAACGVTTVMPTLASAPLDEMIAATDRLRRFVPKAGEADFCGVHLEGRYLNPTKRGAHAPELLAPLCAEELDAEVFRMCRFLHITAAYELDDGSFAAKAKAIGATMGLGHTAATYRQAKRAEENGITAYTHLFNAMPPLHHRDGGCVCAALEGNAFAELICDGIHVSPEMVRLAYRAKTNHRIVLISDSMEATGCPDGHYSIAGSPVTVTNGKALTPEGALAGSTLSLNEAVNNLIDFCGIPLTEALLCATENPAREVGGEELFGRIAVGCRADLLFLADTNRLDIRRVMLRGEFI